jgi:hypothetical protein
MKKVTRRDFGAFGIGAFGIGAVGFGPLAVSTGILTLSKPALAQS